MYKCDINNETIRKVIITILESDDYLEVIEYPEQVADEIVEAARIGNFDEETLTNIVEKWNNKNKDKENKEQFLNKLDRLTQKKKNLELKI